VTYITTICY